MTEVAEIRRGEDRFRVQLDVFEGPLDLLLFLIRRRELEITDVALAAVTSQYLAFLDLFRSFEMSLAGQWLVCAATLVEVKSRLLLPRPVRQGEESTEAEASAELIQRLREHQQLQAVSAQLGQLQEDSLRRWLRPSGPETPAPPPIIDQGLIELCLALEQLAEKKRRPPEHQVELDSWSVTLKMQELVHLLSEGGKVDLTTLLLASQARGEAVATILAALEVCRIQPRVHLQQDAPFATVHLLMESA